MSMADEPDRRPFYTIECEELFEYEGPVGEPPPGYSPVVPWAVRPADPAETPPPPEPPPANPPQEPA